MDEGVLTTVLFFGIILILAIVIAVLYLVATEFYRIACEKGYEESKYFHFSLYLGIAGWIMVAALPDRSDRIQNKKRTARHVQREKAFQEKSKGSYADLSEVFEKNGERVLRVDVLSSDEPEYYETCDSCGQKKEEILSIKTADRVGVERQYFLCRDCLADFNK